ncbi:MAG: PEP-CTERM sorting domain-containing protein [Candidatus Omnitrophica bacterium]|nr:PEP-CTERM sorting domain-containing protein [Candidatus Omnitrophota bacterium]
MRKLFIVFTTMALTVAFHATSFAATPVDLTSWSDLTLDLGGGQSAGNWVLSNANTTATQTINADPSFFLNNLNQTSYSIDGSWLVLPGTGDDDFMGFVFGFSGPNQTYVFDWKAANQSLSPYGDALEGFSIKKINAPDVADLVLADFWDKDGTTHTTILDSNWSTTNGWVAGKTYDFHLDFDPGVISIVVKDGATELWNTTVNDNMYTAGQFGFYNFSQASVQYSGFEQTGGVIVPPGGGSGVVPEPASMLLFGGGLLGSVISRRRKK